MGNQIYLTNDGDLVTERYLMWEFIKSTEQTEEYILFKLALSKTEKDLKR